MDWSGGHQLLDEWRRGAILYPAAGHVGMERMKDLLNENHGVGHGNECTFAWSFAPMVLQIVYRNSVMLLQRAVSCLLIGGFDLLTSTKLLRRLATQLFNPQRYSLNPYLTRQFRIGNRIALRAVYIFTSSFNSCFSGRGTLSSEIFFLAL
jgi:hypothetical protein